MTLSEIFWGIGDVFGWTFQLFEITGNILNNSFLILGFVGLFYWLNLQKKYSEQAANDENQLK